MLRLSMELFNLNMILKTYNHVKEDRIMEEFQSKSGKVT